MFIPEISYFYVDRALSIFGKLLTGGVAPLVSIAIYVFTALSLYTVAKRRGIAAPWLAWVPVAGLWVLGSLSDQYRYLTQGQIRHKRISLLVWTGASWVLTGGIVVGTIAAIAGASVGAILTVLCLALAVAQPLSMWCCISWRCTMSMPPAIPRTRRCIWCCPFSSDSWCPCSCSSPGTWRRVCPPERKRRRMLPLRKVRNSEFACR